MTKERKLCEQALKVLAHAAVQENNACGKNAAKFTNIYFQFRDYVSTL